MTIHKVELDAESVDRIMICGLRAMRDDIQSDKSKHPEDVAANALRVSAIGVILGYMGAK